ncbi:uncharacterized protein LOC131670927 isoform X2 [Phymastichus coffea]|uniref:uncharacterized protein LOC131670927 isoform X2 n=1 Tax=Phymastichus coffea TaxID=108790 RepID=UPI00273C2A23|nr:uncharacterized protein LOC131670927 isoform X2 [Phymastichus coffea]
MSEPRERTYLGLDFSTQQDVRRRAAPEGRAGLGGGADADVGEGAGHDPGPAASLRGGLRPRGRRVRLRAATRHGLLGAGRAARAQSPRPGPLPARAAGRGVLGVARADLDGLEHRRRMQAPGGGRRWGEGTYPSRATRGEPAARDVLSEAGGDHGLEGDGALRGTADRQAREEAARGLREHRADIAGEQLRGLAVPRRLRPDRLGGRLGHEPAGHPREGLARRAARGVRTRAAREARPAGVLEHGPGAAVRLLRGALRLPRGLPGGGVHRRQPLLACRPAAEGGRAGLQPGHQRRPLPVPEPPANLDRRQRVLQPGAGRRVHGAHMVRLGRARARAPTTRTLCSLSPNQLQERLADARARARRGGRLGLAAVRRAAGQHAARQLRQLGAVLRRAGDPAARPRRRPPLQPGRRPRGQVQLGGGGGARARRGTIRGQEGARRGLWLRRRSRLQNRGHGRRLRQQGHAAGARRRLRLARPRLGSGQLGGAGRRLQGQARAARGRAQLRGAAQLPARAHARLSAVPRRREHLQADAAALPSDRRTTDIGPTLGLTTRATHSKAHALEARACDDHLPELPARRGDDGRETLHRLDSPERSAAAPRLLLRAALLRESDARRDTPLPLLRHRPGRVFRLGSRALRRAPRERPAGPAPACASRPPRYRRR